MARPNNESRREARKSGAKASPSQSRPKEIILQDGKYQFMPPCPPEEDARLKAAIEATWKAGLFPDVPLYVDLENYILDGHRRFRSYREIGIRQFTVRKVDVGGLSDEQIRFLVETLNANRRQENLANQRKRWTAIDRFLLLDPWASSRQVAEHFEVDKNQVERRRKQLEETGAIAPVKRSRGGPRQARIISTQNVREFLYACKDIDTLGGIVAPTLRGQKEAADRKRREEEAARGRRLRIDQNFPILHCRFEALLDRMPELRGAAAHVLADPSWAEKDLCVYKPLAETARDLLMPGRILTVWTGKRHVDRSLPILSTYLTFVQMAFYTHTAFERRKVMGQGIPVLSRCTVYAIYLKGEKFQWDHKPPILVDMRYRHGPMKARHDWGLNPKDVADVIWTFTKPGELVVDLTGGSFSAAIACWFLRRRYVGCDIDRNAVHAGRQWLDDVQKGRVEDPMKGWVQPDLRG